MKALITALVLAMLALALGCPIDPPGPGPMAWIEFSIDGGASYTFSNGPTDLAMDEPGEPFLAIRSNDTVDTLYLYALAEDGAFVEGAEATDRIIVIVNADLASYSGTFTSNILVSAQLEGTRYYNSGPNTLTLDSAVTATPSGSLVTGSFSGTVSTDAVPEGMPIAGSFSLKNMAVTFPPSGG